MGTHILSRSGLRPGALSSLVSAALLAAALLATAPSAGATASVTATRLGGADRYATAGVVAQHTSFSPNGTPVAVLASGLNFPDALSGAYLAGRFHAPILLTDPNQLSSETLSALQALGVHGVDLVGGTTAISQTVANTLTADNYTVDRISGPDRYGTAAAIATGFPATFVGSFPNPNGTSDGPTAIVASGLNFPDALSGSPMSFSAAFPIILTDPASLPAESSAALRSLGIAHVVLLGGTTAISDTVQGQITGLGITVTRVAGADRTQTATMIAGIEATNLGYAITHVNLARGDLYPDALAGGAHAGAEKEPILLTASPTTLGAYATAYLRSNASTIQSIHVYGGTSAVSDATVAAAVAAAG